MLFLNFDRLPPIFASLGKCSKCMKLAFVTALGAIVVTAALFVTAPLWLALAGAAASAGLTLLWIAHVWFYTMRSIRATSPT